MIPVNTDSISRDAVKQAACRVALRLGSPAPGDSFAEKIQLVSNVPRKEECFNVWHAGNDKVTDVSTWGRLAKRIDQAR